MQFFLDSADLNEIKKFNDLGIIDGVTTNPSLMSKQGLSFEEAAKKICEIVNGPVSLEVISTDFNGMIKEAVKLSKISSNVVVKIPCIPEGIKALKACYNKGIKTNCTLVFNSGQALLAAKNNASYVSPFVGRLDDISNNGIHLIEDIIRIYKNYGFKTKVLVASVRSPMHVIESALIGADVITCPPKILNQLMMHPKTDEGLKKFLDDWNKKEKLKI